LGEDLEELDIQRAEVIAEMIRRCHEIDDYLAVFVSDTVHEWSKREIRRKHADYVEDGDVEP
jgi:hypothetical protein